MRITRMPCISNLLSRKRRNFQGRKAWIRCTAFASGLLHLDAKLYSLLLNLEARNPTSEALYLQHRPMNTSACREHPPWSSWENLHLADKSGMQSSTQGRIYFTSLAWSNFLVPPLMSNLCHRRSVQLNQNQLALQKLGSMPEVPRCWLRDESSKDQVTCINKVPRTPPPSCHLSWEFSRKKWKNYFLNTRSTKLCIIWTVLLTKKKLYFLFKQPIQKVSTCSIINNIHKCKEFR